MQITDLAGVSKPLTKLIEVVSAATGTVYRPRAIRKEAEARAYEIELIGEAQTRVDANRIIALADAASCIEERSQARQTHKALQSQRNIEAIAMAAVDQLPDEVSTDPLDNDWRTRFFNIAEEVSSEQMQQHWGKILAGEIAKPGSFSLRTLEVMRNLTQAEAIIFQRARYLATDNGTIPSVNSNMGIGMEEFGVSFKEILKLREAGLLMDGDQLSIGLKLTSPHRFSTLGYNGMKLRFEALNPKADEIRLPILLLSNAGKELLTLIEPAVNMDFLYKVASSQQGNFNLSIGEIEAPLEAFVKLEVNNLSTTFNDA